MSNEVTGEQIREAVRERYSAAARQVQQRQGASCCSESGCAGANSQIYDLDQLEQVPQAAALASLGCGNPTLLAELREGETVLDLGSGGGIDVLLSARRVGPSGKAYGLDMTDEMLELARANARQAGVSNVEFLKGQIEAIPLPDESVDVIISNCVINLSADKDAVLREAFRVLKPGGRFAVADIVVQGGPLPAPVREMMGLWAGCIAGALEEREYRAKLGAAGFQDIDLEVLKVYGLEDVPDEMQGCIPEGLSLPGDTRIVSAFIKATKTGEGGSEGEARALKIVGIPSARAKSAGSACCGSLSSTSLRAEAASSRCCGDTVKSYFKRVAPQWDSLRRSYFTEEVREAAIGRANLTPDSVVADVGTGTGFMLAGLAPLVRRAIGFDNSPEMLGVAAKNLGGAANVELRVAEGDSLPLPEGSLDAVFANMYLHHAPDPAAAVAELARVLKPGGRLVITDLDSHDQAWMSAEMADLWTGFERPQIEAFFRAAGLADVRVECTGSSCCGASAGGEAANISIFVASGTKEGVS